MASEEFDRVNIVYSSATLTDASESKIWFMETWVQSDFADLVDFVEGWEKTWISGQSAKQFTLGLL